METYSKEFTAFKQDKKLRWLPLLGTLDLCIELGDRELEVRVPPLEAAIIELFSNKGTHSCVCVLCHLICRRNR